MIAVATRPPHLPVLRDRVAELIADAPDGPVLDATVGAGGHAEAIARTRLARYGSARLIGIDRDPEALDEARRRLSELPGELRLDLVRARFDAVGEVLDGLGIDRVSGVLFDLGMSSMHVDQAGRGFSFRHSGPLDMRMDPDQPTTAADLVNDLDRAELARLIRAYGEEPFADRIARAIVAARPMGNTDELAEVIRQAVPARARRTGRHPATRTFQALRIAVNAELEALDARTASSSGTWPAPPVAASARRTCRSADAGAPRWWSTSCGVRSGRARTRSPPTPVPPQPVFGPSDGCRHECPSRPTRTSAAHAPHGGALGESEPSPAPAQGGRGAETAPPSAVRDADDRGRGLGGVRDRQPQRAGGRQRGGGP